MNTYFVLEATKGSNIRFYKDPVCGAFVYRRHGFNSFPTHYGFVERYDESNLLIKEEKDALDFFLISNLDFRVGHYIKEKDVQKLMILKCIDEATMEEDDKLIVRLKGEGTDHRSLCNAVDNIISFLICKRSCFKIVGVSFEDTCVKEIRDLYESIDWSKNLLWPTDFKLDNPETLLS